MYNSQMLQAQTNRKKMLVIINVNAESEKIAKWSLLKSKKKYDTE